MTSPQVRKATTSTTTNVVSTDFGQTWLLGDPKNGILPLLDPFPLRSGNRYQVPVGSSLGADTILAPGGGGFTAENPDSRPLAGAAVAHRMAARPRRSHGD